jgi:predicted enzyme related to lactoylglutathione lyase
MACPKGEPFAAAATSPGLTAAYDELIGAGRWTPRAAVGGTVPVRLPSEDCPGEVGYHIEGNWWRGEPQKRRVRGRQSSVRDTDGMPVRLHHIVVDAHDLPGLARFWTQALGWKVLSEREREIVIGTDESALVGMCFMPVTDSKTVKNRVHLDLTSSAQDRDQEIERLLALGARRVDIGQTGAESWRVLADPEGNEFCVIRPKETLIR